MNSSNPWDLDVVSGQAIWGYGRYGDDQLLPFSFDDMRHDAEAAEAALLALALPERSVVVVTSTVADVGYFHPFQSAARALDLVACNADASAMDVDRLEMFIRILPVAAVIGVTDAVVDGILERERDLKEFFASVPVVVASAPAQRRLLDAGGDALPFEILGPLLAFPCREGSLHYDGRQWTVEEDHGTLRVSSRGRALASTNFDTGRRGSVSETWCHCGRRDPMIRIS
jgi:hypothetical protein